MNKKVGNGDEISVDLENSIVVIIKTGEVIQCEKMGEHALSILNAGGIKKLMKQKYGNKNVNQ